MLLVRIWSAIFSKYFAGRVLKIIKSEEKWKQFTDSAAIRTDHKLKQKTERAMQYFSFYIFIHTNISENQ